MPRTGRKNGFARGGIRLKRRLALDFGRCSSALCKRRLTAVGFLAG
jgi:hypothetical protein